MQKEKLFVIKSLTTALTVAKVGEVAAETGVSLTTLETRFAGKGKWINDFEVAGTPGKVEAFFTRIADLRND